MNSHFLKGSELAAAFYRQAAQPILGVHFPEVPYSAALIGWGSEVLGYDDEISSDHHWGPRFLLFLSEEDYRRHGKAISSVLSENLPYRFPGYSASEHTYTGPLVLDPASPEGGPSTLQVSADFRNNRSHDTLEFEQVAALIPGEFV